MRIEATDIGRTFGRQTRAYAEYRVFASLARFTDAVREVRVSLAPAATSHMILCSVVVALETGVSVRVTGRGRHAYDAINRVAYRLGPAVRRRAQGAPPPDHDDPAAAAPAGDVRRPIATAGRGD